jgi:hypothetical protein
MAAALSERGCSFPAFLLASLSLSLSLSLCVREVGPKSKFLASQQAASDLGFDSREPVLSKAVPQYRPLDMAPGLPNLLNWRLRRFQEKPFLPTYLLLTYQVRTCVVGLVG